MSKLKKKFFVNDSAQADRISETLGYFANEQVDTDRAFLNVNGYVISVRLPY